MAPTPGQGLQPLSSAGSGRGDDVSNFSLLGQQFKCCCPAQHRGQSSQTGLTGFSMASLAPQNHVAPLSQRSQCPAAPDNRANVANSGLGRCLSNVQDQQIPLAQGYDPPYGAHGINQSSFRENNGSSSSAAKTCNPQALLNTLSGLEQKIHQLRSVVQLIAQEGGRSFTNMVQQQDVMTSVASIISQVMVAAVGMLPSSQQLGLVLFPGSTDLQSGYPFGVAPGLGLDGFQQNEIGNSTIRAVNAPVGGNNLFGLEVGLRGPNIGVPVGSSHSVPPQNSLGSSNPRHTLDTSLNAGPGNAKMTGGDADTSNCHNGNTTANPSGNSSHTSQGSGVVPLDDHDIGGSTRDEDDDGEEESLPPGSYELIEMDAVELLAEHTHFCEICGKGFKRDANLRMHMRGHGDEYKTPAALAKPDKGQDIAPVRSRRYSCPCVGCKRNKKHKKFQPLKTMLCVKNHYRRSHCPKMFTCKRCKNKKFSVIADLKTHEKHCGRDKWQCSCGTTFSRKDKLFGHIALFQGHTPAFPPNEIEGSGVTDELANKGPHSIENTGTSYANACGNIVGVLASSGVVDSCYGNGNVSSIGPGANEPGLETDDGYVDGRLGLKNISFSQEDNEHAMQEGFLKPNVWVSSGSFHSDDRAACVPCLAL